MPHELKTWSEPFTAILDGRKRFELRKQDRDFRVGDHLRLREYDPSSGTYTGRETWRVVTYMIRGGEWGLPLDLCIMGIEKDESHADVG